MTYLLLIQSESGKNVMVEQYVYLQTRGKFDFEFTLIVLVPICLQIASHDQVLW